MFQSGDNAGQAAAQSGDNAGQTAAQTGRDGQKNPEALEEGQENPAAGEDSQEDLAAEGENLPGAGSEADGGENGQESVGVIQAVMQGGGNALRERLQPGRTGKIGRAHV